MASSAAPYKQLNENEWVGGSSLVSSPVAGGASFPAQQTMAAHLDSVPAPAFPGAARAPLGEQRTVPEIAERTPAQDPADRSADAADDTPEAGPQSASYSFGPTTFVLGQYGLKVSAGEWKSLGFSPRVLGDVNGDGLDDIVGFGKAGVFVSLSNGNGTFAPHGPSPVLAQFGSNAGAGGWASNSDNPRQVADVNGDGRVDIVGFGNAGVYVALGTAAGGFGSMFLAKQEFGRYSGGWNNQDDRPRQVADVNGDGRADIVGFGNNSVWVALGQANGTFGAHTAVMADFSFDQGWQTTDKNPRHLADVNGDGRADIVAFGNSAVYVALGQANGRFSAKFAATPDFTVGWSNNANPRQLADINGDGRADIVGFGNAGVYFALGTVSGSFGTIQFLRPGFGTHEGWSTQGIYPRRLADINGDGAADIVGFGNDGVFVSRSNQIAKAIGPNDQPLNPADVGEISPDSFQFAQHTLATRLASSEELVGRNAGAQADYPSFVGQPINDDLVPGAVDIPAGDFLV